MSSADAPVLAKLEVSRVILLEELKRMNKVLGRSRSGEALVMYDVGSLQIRIGGAECAIPASTIPCKWQVPGAAIIEAPLGTELLALIQLSMAHTDEELEKSGLGRAVADARAELDKRIKAAARQLAPLGVSECDVRLLVTGKFGAR